MRTAKYMLLLLSFAPWVSVSHADVITQWNEVSISAIQTAQYTAVKVSRTLAMVHAAMFDSINAVDQIYHPYYVTTTSPEVSREAAAATAAYRVLSSLFPGQIASFDAALAASLAGIPDGPAKTDGIALGDDVGNQIVTLRSTDHSDDTVVYTPGTGPGVWQPTPPGLVPAMMPHWATVTPFAMTSGSQFRPAGPPALTSATYTQEFNEVKTLGAKVSSVRTAEQAGITHFWMDMPGTITTAGRWNAIARQVSGHHGLNLWQNARLFALLNIAMADAGIASWDCKYAYNFWRPITAIRDALNDDNPLTDPNEVWEPFIMTPAFPEYVSAHSTFSAAAAQVLGSFFGHHSSFSIESYTTPTTTRFYHSFVQAAEEAGMSRIYGGIHFSSANLFGQAMGGSIGAYVFQNFLKPVSTDIGGGTADTDGIDTDGDGDPNNDHVFPHMAAGDGFANMADGKLQYTFGFSDVTDVPEDMVMHHAMLAATFPAPTLVFREGQKVYLSLTNVGMIKRPDLFDPHSIHWHGFPNAAPVFDGVPDASISINMGSTLTYYYNVVEPGTFVWHCHVEATEHMQMGMLGQLYVTPKQNVRPDGTDLSGFTHHSGYKYVYNDGDGSTYYDVEYPLQLAGFDPRFHDEHIAVQPLPFAMMKDKYGMINGRGYPQTVDTNSLPNSYDGKLSQKQHALITANQGQKVLLRLSCLSTVDYFTVTTTLGVPMKVVGKGARLLRGPNGKDTSYLTSSVTLGGGETADVIIDTTGVAPGTYVLYTTNLNFLSNDKQDFGGIMTEIIIHGPGGGHMMP